MITVYIPTYNRARFLSGALTSLRAQTLSRDRFRVVVADNASDDETSSVVRKFQDLDLIYLRRGKNQGALANFNGVRDFLDTEYVHFLSDDDLLAPFHLEYVLSQLEKMPEAGLFGTGAQAGEGLWTSDIRRADFLPGDGYIDQNDQLCHWSAEMWLAVHSIVTAVSQNACLFRSAILRSLGTLFEEPDVINDRWFLAQVGAQTACVTSPWPTCTLRFHGANWVHGKSLPIEDCRVVAERVIKLSRDRGYDLAAFWRSFLQRNSSRTDVMGLIYQCYPPELARSIVSRRGLRPAGKLDRLHLPAPVKQGIRRVKGALIG